uniref:(California timema) hypothetical protein n=1 Tax=Timema californicum TaxID=61474 RepID=A0A7R9PC08_TIMCA|nr:unnamed protein product [Timema californicum]
MFQNYRIPRENLLNRTSDVTAEGDYETSFSNPEQQLGAALENLSAGRVGIMQESVATLATAITIAIRYSAVRRQFGPDPDGEELPIIEYEMQQWRLFPYVAAACALRIFIESFIDQYLECVEMSHSGAKLAHLCNATGHWAINCQKIRKWNEQAAKNAESVCLAMTDMSNNVYHSQLASEIHAMVSSSKPLLTWTCSRAIQECREACGGHGYLKVARTWPRRQDTSTAERVVHVHGELSRATPYPVVTAEGSESDAAVAMVLRDGAGRRILHVVLTHGSSNDHQYRCVRNRSRRRLFTSRSFDQLSARDGSAMLENLVFFKRMISADIWLG